MKRREACAATYAVVDGVSGAEAIEQQLNSELFRLEDALFLLDNEWKSRGSA